MAAIKTRVVRTANGLWLPVAEHGDPAGTPVLMIHGYTDSWTSFAQVLPHLPSSLRAVAVTLRGHGDADKPTSGYRPADFAGDLAALMDRLGMGAAVIVGHSMGALVALQFALDHPGRTTGLVLAGAFPGGRGNPAVAELAEAVGGFGNKVPHDFALEFQRSTVAQPVPAGLIEAAAVESMKTPVRVWKAACAGFADFDLSPRLGRIDAPTLVVWGDRDSFFPQAVQDVVTLGIRGSRMIAYRGAGHALHWEEPQRFADDVAAFAAEMPALAAAV